VLLKQVKNATTQNSAMISKGAIDIAHTRIFTASRSCEWTAGLRLRRQKLGVRRIGGCKALSRTESASVIESKKGLRLPERVDELGGAVFGAKKRAFPRCLLELTGACGSSWECQWLMLMLMAASSSTTTHLPSLACLPSLASPPRAKECSWVLQRSSVLGKA
jgi:hypothetical protein